MKYFIIVNDAQQGPYTVDELRQRNISSETLVWAEGMQQWTPAWQVEELKPLFYDTTNTQQTTSAQAGSAQTGFAQQSATGSVPPPPPVNNMGNPAGTMVPPVNQPNKNNKKKAWTYVGIAVAILLLLMAILNPSKDEHKQVIKDRITNGLTKGLSDNGDSDDPFATFGSAIVRSLATPVLGQIVDNMIQYHNYLFWSTTTLALPDSSEVRTSFGIFGKVFTSDETAIAEAVSKTLKSEGDESTHTSVVRDSGTDEDGNPYSGVTQTVTDSVVSVGSKVGKTLVKHVSSEVGRELKKELNQSADSATASGLGKIIDDIESFLKGL